MWKKSGTWARSWWEFFHIYNVSKWPGTPIPSLISVWQETSICGVRRGRAADGPTTAGGPSWMDASSFSLIFVIFNECFSLQASFWLTRTPQAPRLFLRWTQCLRAFLSLKETFLYPSLERTVVSPKLDTSVLHILILGKCKFFRVVFMLIILLRLLPFVQLVRSRTRPHDIFSHPPRQEDNTPTRQVRHAHPMRSTCKTKMYHSLLN